MFHFKYLWFCWLFTCVAFALFSSFVVRFWCAVIFCVVSISHRAIGKAYCLYQMVRLRFCTVNANVRTRNSWKPLRPLKILNMNSEMQKEHIRTPQTMDWTPPWKHSKHFKTSQATLKRNKNNGGFKELNSPWVCSHLPHGPLSGDATWKKNMADLPLWPPRVVTGDEWFNKKPLHSMFFFGRSTVRCTLNSSATSYDLVSHVQIWFSLSRSV